jgi:SAM-dependent methyltransferase/predicted NAD/FAD-dependent oxidoreductase
MEMRVSIVGGGPGGLMTARIVESFGKGLCDITLFESSERLGGKIVTRHFDKADVIYEAGVAELYDYSHLGPDPLKELILGLGLDVQPIRGHAVVLDGKMLCDGKDIERLCGPKTLKALDDFYKKCAELYTPIQYYEGHNKNDNVHPWAGKTFKEVLDEISNETARKYVVVASKSDVITEAHMTSALDGLKNILMDDPNYLRLYSIVGGNEQLTRRIVENLTATNIRLNGAVTRVDRSKGGSLRLTVRYATRYEQHDFDSAVLALPNSWLERIEWGNRDLRLAMEKHLAHYAYPTHYLRVSILFEDPFWRKAIPGDFWMSDAFGGCCIYDEGARHPCEPYGVLGWLLAGNDAMVLGNLDDATLIKMALDLLPDWMATGRALMIEGKVHRWVGTVNGLPGGNPVHSLRRRHMPEPANHANLLLVGDYMFDATLNGVYDSAHYATGLILTRLRKLTYAEQIKVGAIGDRYFEFYSGECSYEDAFEDLFNAEYTVDLIAVVWGQKPAYKLLDCGSANGLTLEQFEKYGIEAWGIENNKNIHAKTSEEWLKRNLLGDVREMPFEDNSFDFVYVTCLCYLPEEEIDDAIRELFRVCRIGIVAMGVATDMTPEVIEDHNLLVGVRTHWTLREWSEAFVKNGFRLAISDPAVLNEVWRVEQETDEDDWNWYPDKESIRYCFFSKPDVETRRLSAPTPADALPRTPIPRHSDAR